MFELMVTGAKGLDELLQTELQQLCPDRATKLKPGQVWLEADLADAYRICLHSRLANRVLLKIAAGKIEQADDLYRIADSVIWSEHFNLHQTFMVDFIGTNRTINNSQFGALKIKDAIVDQFNSRFGKRPSVSKINADIRIQARLWRQEITLYLDLSGQSLHQRHYRQDSGKAPLKEHLASAMLMRSGWAENMETPLYDPMCGSGTIVIEAALMAANIPPGRNRKIWGFSQWRQHDQALWLQIVEQAESAIKPVDTAIFANDIDSRLIQIAKSNARAAGVDGEIQFSCDDAVKHIPVTANAGYLVSNPPYGERLSEVTALLPLFDDLGLHLKQHFQNWKLSLLTSNRELFRQLKLSAKKQYQLMNGKLECQLVNYEMDERNCIIRENQPLNSDFANRLDKNIQRTNKWLKSQNTDCYRIYDADLPEYNVAIDCYADWLVVQEYAAPKNVPEAKARQRIHQILAALPKIMQSDPDKVVLKVREQQKGKEQYQKLAQRHEYIQVHENGAQFQVNLRDYLDTGLFLDHRITRQRVQQRVKGKHVLNLFAYTGSVSVHAALGKAASVTTVDMSHTYIDWAKRNFQLNNLSGSQYQFIQADCTAWLAEHQAKYDLIFIDPPSFSNSKRMDNTWDVQRDHIQLLTQARARLQPGGEIIFSNNLRRFKLDDEAVKALGLNIEDWSQQTLPEDFKRNPKIHHCWLFSDVG